MLERLLTIGGFFGNWMTVFIGTLAGLPTHYRHSPALQHGARRADDRTTIANWGMVIAFAWIFAVLLVAWWTNETSAIAMGMAVAKPKTPPIIKYEGKEITLPSDPTKMSLDNGIAWLTKIRNDQEAEINVVEEVPGYDPMDVAHALMLAIKQVYGFAESAPWGNAVIDMKTDLHTTVQVPWGQFRLPIVSGTLQTHVKPYSAPPIFTLQVVGIKKKDAPAIKSLMDVVRGILKTDSIYQGKAIKFMWDDDNDNAKPFEFVDVASADPAGLIFSADITEQIGTTIFTPLVKRELCKSLRVPFKRGVCLMGPYGTGKTLAMYVAAKYATANGVTTIIVEDAQHLAYAMRSARQYAPSLVICEDIDRVTKQRDDTCDDIMDALDGAEAKDRDVMVLFTSNDGESIHEAMRRPGRIDTFIKVLPPDAPAVEKLLRLYGKGRIAASENLTDVCAMLAGQIPAVIREVVERAKLAAIARADTIADASELWAEDLAVSARRMLMQIDLFSDKQMDDAALTLASAAAVMSQHGASLVSMAKIAKASSVPLASRN